ncbi:MAG: hypothetical protein NC453_06510 [Muribaculum sp.]|nr:hypothetical protein [Muribaculum sp.]
MDIVEISIRQNQKMSDIYPIIESNVILNKTLSGIGATFSEIKAKRDSIIVVPNLPVIANKVVQHKKDNLFGVHQKVTVDDLISYIENSRDKRKRIKILVTPESFYKILKAFSELNIDIYNQCFLLLDESHKFIKDKDFRHEITQPLKHFFSFRNKALVSATPIIPSDPRFEDEKFKIIKIIPDYNHLQEISITQTNNVLQAFKDFLIHLKVQHNMENRSACFFVNSVDMIQQFIDKSNLLNDSAVFCSEKSVEKLKHLGIKNVHCEWSPKFLKPYMFFTSRFYNGLDIILEFQPYVVFISDPYRKDFSIVDPSTDMPQAIGRFRRGVYNVEHIVAFNNEIEVRSKDGLLDFIESIEHTYAYLKCAYNNSDSSEERRAFQAFIENMPMKELFTDGIKDHFVVDNYIDSELVKSSYKNIALLTERYALSRYFRIPLINKQYYPYGERERLAIFESKKYKKEQRIEIVKALDAINGSGGTETGNQYIRELRDYDDLIVDAYFKLGKEVIEQNNYRTKKLRELIILKDYDANTRTESFIKAINNSFKVGQRYSREYVKKELLRLHKLFSIVPPAAITALSIGFFFDIDEKARIGDGKAIRLIRPNIKNASYFFKRMSKE